MAAQLVFDPASGPGSLRPLRPLQGPDHTGHLVRTRIPPKPRTSCRLRASTKPELWARTARPAALFTATGGQAVWQASWTHAPQAARRGLGVHLGEHLIDALLQLRHALRALPIPARPVHSLLLAAHTAQAMLFTDFQGPQESTSKW